MPANKSPLSSRQLRDQKTLAETRLDELRQEQVVALEQGQDFKNNNEILFLNEKLAALDKAIARAEERETKEAHRLQLVNTRSRALHLVDEIQRRESDRLEAVAAVEAAVRATVDAIVRYQEQAKRSRESCSAAAAFYNTQPEDFRRLKHIIYSSSDIAVPELGGQRLSNRLGDYMASTLSELIDGSNSGGLYGATVWSRMAPLPHSWADAERIAVNGLVDRNLLLNLRHIAGCIPEAGE